MSSSLAALDRTGGVSPVDKARAELERIRSLRSRITQMQRTRLDTTALPTLPAFAPVLPDGALHTGAAYSVTESLSLVMGLLSAPSAAGAWCGVVGVPEFGVEAAARFGIDLERTVLVPSPGDQWLTVTAALADALTIVVTRPAGRVSDADAARLGARLRQREATLIALGNWPRSEIRLAISESVWNGLERGHGYPTGRRVRIVADGRGMGTVRSTSVWLPDAETRIRQAQNSDADERREHPLEAVG